MAQMKKPVPASMLKKVTETAKQKAKVKITGSASTTPRVSASMIKSQPVTTSKPKAPAISKTTTKVTPKSKPLTGPEAVKAIQNRVSPAGVKKAEADAKKATKKKYPGLYKK